MLQLEDAKEVGPHLDEHAFAHACGLNGAHASGPAGFLNADDPGSGSRANAAAGCGVSEPGKP
jgi:hypothetical protein